MRTKKIKVDLEKETKGEDVCKILWAVVTQVKTINDRLNKVTEEVNKISKKFEKKNSQN